jgi:hypothetical protein
VGQEISVKARHAALTKLLEHVALAGGDAARQRDSQHCSSHMFVDVA